MAVLTPKKMKEEGQKKKKATNQGVHLSRKAQAAVLTSSRKKMIEESQKKKEESQKTKKATNEGVYLAPEDMIQFEKVDSVTEFRKQLEDIKPCQGGDSVIFKVPSRLQKLEPAAFMPRVVSIGPYHHKKHEHHKEIETHKWRLLQHVLDQAQLPRLLDDLWSDMDHLVNDTKKCYDKPIEGLTKPQFVEMMLLDACFVLELLRVSVNGWRSCGYTSDPFVVFNLRGFIPFIQQDMLMLENQLPFSVLDKFFTRVFSPQDLLTHELIVDLVLKFFDPVIPGISKNLSKKNESPLHILHIVHMSLEPSQKAAEQRSETDTSTRGCCPGPSLRLFPGPNSFSFPCWQKTNHGHDAARTVQDEEGEKGSLQSPPATTTNCSPVQDRTGRTVVRENKEEEEGHGAAIQEEEEGTIPNSPEIAIHSVTRLTGTGIIFETKDSTKLTDIEFKEGKLLIPPLLIHGSTKLIFLNLMAFEQCRLHCENYITSYISFMDELINTPKDVEHLIEKRIIVHYLGSEKDVATLFNNIRKEIAIDPSNSYLLDVSQKLNKHYQQKWQNWKAILKHEYLKNPWKIISLVAAGLLILLTAAQTIYTMLSYHFPKT